MTVAPFLATAHVTDRILNGSVWMRDGWAGLNNVTLDDAVVPGSALNFFQFTVGQADYGAQVDVAANRQ